MRVLTDSTLFELELSAQADSVIFEPKANRDTGEIKKSLEGKPLYGAKGLVILSKDAEGNIQGIEPNSYFSVVTPPTEPVTFGSRWKAKGYIQVNHFRMNGNVAVSIEIEELERIA